MASELPREHPPMALLAGSVPCPLEVEADRAAEAGWRFSQVPDVYAAAARLLRTDRPRPDAVLVLVESLRGDELRFFDLLARRWPDLPAAAVYCRLRRGSSPGGLPPSQCDRAVGQRLRRLADRTAPRLAEP